jgi:hypothetical protein
VRLASLLRAAQLVAFACPALDEASHEAAQVGENATTVVALPASTALVAACLSAPSLVARAAAPLVLASIWASAGDPRAVPLVVAGVVAGGLAALLFLRSI